MAEYLGEHQHALGGIASLMRFSTYERLWAAHGRIKHERLRASARHVINYHFKRAYGFSLLYSPVLRFPASANIANATLKQAAHTVLRAVYAPTVVKRLRRLLRVVRTRATTVGRELHNWRGVCKLFDPAVPGTCTCAHYPPEWRESCPPDVLNVKGHFAILSTAYSGPGRACLRVSHKTPITYSGDSMKGEVYSALSDMLRGLPAAVEPFLDDARAEELRHLAVRRCMDSVLPTPEGAAVDMSTVRKCKTYLSRAVRSEVDKGGGLTCIYCPVANWHLMHLVWPSEPARCKVLENISEFDILYQDILHYHEQGWDRLCALFGVDKNGFPSDRSSVPRCYATWKLKAFLKQVLKGRPISPHTRIPLKLLYNLIASAHQFMLMCIRTGRVSRMFSCGEYATRLENELKALEAKYGMKLCSIREIGDLSEMYTNLYHSDCDESLVRNSERYLASDSVIGGRPLRARKYICMPRQGRRVQGARVGKAYDPEFVTVSIQDILDICVYSNTRSIMYVGTELRQYFQGIPMGEQGSCAKANGVALDAELRCDAQREATHGDSERNLSLDYVDDAHNNVVYSETGAMGWTRDSALEYCADIRGCYPHPLFMEVEPAGQGVYRFLETDTYIPSESDCYVVHHNKPWQRRSYNLAAPGGPLFYRQELNTGVETCRRTLDNTTPRAEGDAAGRIAARLREMLHAVGPGYSDSFVRHVLQRFGAKPGRCAEFMRIYGTAIRQLIWPVK